MRIPLLCLIAGVVGFVGAVPARTMAVVPYPLSVADEASQGSQEASIKSTSISANRSVLDTLTADELQLQHILQDLKQAREALKRAQSKETEDGYSLR